MHNNLFFQIQTLENAIMESVRQNQLPILHASGNYWEVGLSIGRTFKNLIEDTLEKSKSSLDSLLLAFSTPVGAKIYDDCLKLCQQKFPGYLEELQGMSEGCGVPFTNLFLLQIETLVVPNEIPKLPSEVKEEGSRGCSSVMTFSKDNIFLGHTEDGPLSQLNNTFILSAVILDDQTGQKIEEFTTLCYAGYLPGGTMGYNKHGLIHSVNAMNSGLLYRERTPNLFLMRALLKARTREEALEILKDTGTGCSEGFGVNIVFANLDERTVLNIEIGPNPDPNKMESDINIFEVPLGESYAHCNRILRLSLKESDKNIIESSINRHAAIEKYSTPYDFNTIRSILGDESNKSFPVYRNDMSKPYVTLVAGIFDVAERTWSLFTGSPRKSEPVAKLNMEIYS